MTSHDWTGDKARAAVALARALADEPERQDALIDQLFTDASLEALAYLAAALLRHLGPPADEMLAQYGWNLAGDAFMFEGDDW